MFIIFIIFSLYLIYANHIFTNMLRVEGESIRASIDLPYYTEDTLIFSIDRASVTTVSWKQMIFIDGWGFKHGSNRVDYDLYIVLKSAHATYIFSSIDRYSPAVEQVIAFDSEVTKNVNMSGFVASIALDAINDDIYQIGVLLKNRYTGEVHYRLIPDGSSILKSGNVVEFPIHKVSGEIIIDIELPFEYAKDINVAIDGVSLVNQASSLVETLIHVQGWAFRENQDRSEYEVIVILESETEMFAFLAIEVIRPALIDVFEGRGIHLKHSGFSATIPLDNIKDGIYSIGIVLQSKTSNELHYIRRPFTHSLLIQNGMIEFPFDATISDLEN